MPVYPFWGATKIINRKKGTLILSSLLEDLVGFQLVPFLLPPSVWGAT